MFRRSLWYRLVYQPITHPLLLNTDPHTPRGVVPIVDGWSLYVFITTLLYLGVVPHISSLEESFVGTSIVVLLIGLFGSVVAFLIVVTILAPYTLLLGIVQGFRVAWGVSRRIEWLYSTGQMDFLAVTAPGWDGAVEAVAASALRARWRGWLTNGIYEQMLAHYVLSFGLMLVVGIWVAVSTPSPMLYNNPTLTDRLTLSAHHIIVTAGLSALLTALHYIGYRQVRLLGAVTGAFAAARLRHLFGAQTAAVVLYIGILLVGLLLIFGLMFGAGVLFASFGAALGALVAGYALVLCMRMLLAWWLWRQVQLHEG